MPSCEQEDSITTLNTALNKSMILMDSPTERNKIKSGKVIKINTKIQPISTFVESRDTPRKSILKRASILETPGDTNSTNESQILKDSTEEINHAKSSVPRPHNLRDFLKGDSVTSETTPSTFKLTDLSDDEDLWIMDIPKTVNPKELCGQTLSLGNVTKIKIKDERYSAVSRNVNCPLTFVFTTGEENTRYRAINITPTGSIIVRRKLSGLTKQSVENSNDMTVPFPSNLKTRHPFFGPIHDKRKIIRKKRSQ